MEERVEIPIADEIDRILREEEMIFVTAYVAGCTGDEAREIVKFARALAEKSVCSAEEATGALLRATRKMVDELQKCAEQKEVGGEFLQLKTAWERKEDRERRRAAERVNAARFSRQKARETGWRRQKRTRPRRREYRGPDIV